MLKIIISLIALFAFSPILKSQLSVKEVMSGLQLMEDGYGRPLYMHTDYKTEGSPFFNEEYCLAKLKVLNGKQYDNIPVKINLLENLIIFKVNSTELVADVPIERVDFIDCQNSNIISFETGFPKIDNQNEKTLYEVLSSGKLKLLKLYKVSYRDDRPYGSATFIRYFDKTQVLYVYSKEKGISKLNKYWESLISHIAIDKRKQVASYINEHNLNPKKEDDLVTIFNYYNTSLN